MPLYTVHAPPPRSGAAAPDPMDYVFVKEGFCWPALFVPVLWLLFRRMWLVLVIYLVAVLALAAAERAGGGPLPDVATVLGWLWLALEGNQLRRWSLRRRGYRLVDVVEGGRLAAAESRYFHDWPEATETPPAAPPGEPLPPAPPSQPSAEAGDVIGLFPAPGGRS